MENLIEALEAERDAAIEEVAYERQRAEHALARLDRLRQELRAVRTQVRELISQQQRTEARAAAAETTLARQKVPGDQGEVAQQLRLALDSGKRLGRERDRLQQRLVGVEAEAKALRVERDRLAARVQALEGAARLGQQGA